TNDVGREDELLKDALRLAGEGRLEEAEAKLREANSAGPAESPAADLVWRGLETNIQKVGTAAAALNDRTESLRQLEKLLNEGRLDEFDAALRQSWTEADEMRFQAHELLDSGRLEKAAAKFREADALPGRAENDEGAADTIDAPGNRPLAAVVIEGNAT